MRILMGLMMVLMLGGQARAEGLPVWVIGEWAGQHEWGFVQESYLPTVDGGIIGFSRMLSDDKVSHAEMIAMDGAGMTLTMATGRRVAFRLAKSTSKEAVFESGDSERPERLVYRLKSRDELDITLEKDQDGKPWSTTFHLKRRS